MVGLSAACGFHAAPPGGGNGDAAPGDGEIDSPAIAIDAPPPLVDAAPDAPAGSPCANGIKDAGELDVDCGGTCPIACTKIFAPDPNTLALFELNGSLADTSGNNRNATLIGGGFATTPWGMGLSVNGTATQGFQWTAHASLLVHPFTIEMIVKPGQTGCYRKVFGGSDSSDAGWYYCNQFTSYANQQTVTKVGPNLMTNDRHYFALVSTSTTQMDIYLNGTRLGSAPTRLANPPTSAIFFRDDTATQRSEAIAGTIDAVRISKVARTQAEITAIDMRLDAQP
jgi:hypothetical protein